ncbi:Crp/Fnr family transcriptional regulator [Brevundimonas faecalis]|uniref:Crp/Fnr family transcriptional regulator n=1 Tax=Brevundimonas faecalis TaxID=947378 RepID=UPI0036151063
MKNQSYQDDLEVAAASLERVLSSFGALAPGDPLRIRSGFRGPSLLHTPGGAVPMCPERDDARVVARGWIARGAMLEDGRRQIVGLSLPGDVILATETIDTDMAAWALTDAVTLDAAPLRSAVMEGRDVSVRMLDAWRRSRSAERLRLARHVIRLGRLSAYERTAHLLLELYERQSRLGTTEPGVLHLPLTQDVLADILGLSAVHMNRTLQQLRRDRLVDYRAGRTILRDRPGLALAAGLSVIEDVSDESMPGD